MNVPLISSRFVNIAEACDRHPRHSEPSLIEVGNGALLIAWQEYLASELEGEDNAPNRIATLVSHDGGLTWSDHRVLVASDEGDVNVYSPSFLRLANREILFFFFRYHVMEMGRTCLTSCYVRRSSDEGQTFGGESAVWIRRPYSCASHVAKLLRSGRVVLPICRQAGQDWTESDHYESACVFSDDGGQSWRESRGWAGLPLRGAMEPHVEQMSNDRMIMVMRTQLGAVFQSVSCDEGETWSKPQTTGLKSPESCPEIARVPATGRLLMVWNNSDYDPGFASHFGRRSPLSVALSCDDARTWQVIGNIVADSRRCYSNPVCAFWRDQVIVAYFELPYLSSGRMDVRRTHLRAALFSLGELDRLGQTSKVCPD